MHRRTERDVAGETEMAHLVVMNLIACMVIPAALLFSAFQGQAESGRAALKAGDEFELDRSYETSRRSSDGMSSGSSRGSDVLLERIIEVRADASVFEYDLPKDATAEDRAREWKFPVRVLKPATGPMQLLNRPELEARLGSWLKAAKWTRDMCGRWIFTWNAFRIECDPEAVIKDVQLLDPSSPDIREGALYRDESAREPGRLERSTERTSALTATMALDPDAIRKARAESDVTLGELTGEPTTLETALRERAKQSISGTITITFDLDATGNVRRRTRVVELETKRLDGTSEAETIKQTVERRPL